MKSLSKVQSLASSKQLGSWQPSELLVEAKDVPVDMPVEQILALFREEQKISSTEQRPKQNSALHPRGLDVAPGDWMPRDLDIAAVYPETSAWEFPALSVDPSTSTEPSTLQEKLEAEKESAEIIRQACIQADELLAQARKEADEIRRHTQDEIAEAKNAGYQAAFQELQETLAATCAIVEDTRQWQTELIKQGEPILIQMLKEIAQTMFGEGIQLDANALQMNLNRVMEHAQRLGDINIFLNPRDAELLDPSWSNYQLLITGNRVRIIASEKIMPGGCLVKGITGTVDARVEAQLTSVLNCVDEIAEMEH